MTRHEAAVGDVIAVRGSGASPGARGRSGTVVAVLGSAGRRLYRVRWTDGTESVYRADGEVAVRPGARVPTLAR